MSKINDGAKCDNCPYFVMRQKPNWYRECRFNATIAHHHAQHSGEYDHFCPDDDFVCGSHPDFLIEDSYT